MMSMLMLVAIILFGEMSIVANSFSATGGSSSSSKKNKNNKDAKSLLSNIFDNVLGGELSPSLWSSSDAQQQREEDSQRRNELKRRMLLECDSERGQNKKNKQERRKTIEAIMYELAELSPCRDDAATSSLLRREWLLRYTTEREINFFVDFGLSNRITQTIGKDGVLLTNTIKFKSSGGGYFGVKGTLSPEGDANKVRTNFVFETATLDIGKWGSYNFPPIGRGWFDTVYLDDDLRVDFNSRSDILVCTPAAASPEPE